MGLIQNISGYFRSKIVGWLEGGGNATFSDRSYNMAARRDYRLGAQRRFLRKTREGFDDNVVGNFLGLALDRGVSLLFGKPVEFEWEEEVPEETVDYIEKIWEDNNKAILLHKLAMYGAEDGTVFAKLVPDQAKYWRIIAQDPIFKDIITDPDDDEIVNAYITQYKTADQNGNETAKRETVARNNYINPGAPADNWIIRNEISNRETGGKWVTVSEEVWPYPLPPIVHWQNLPMVGNVWGMPDISDDVIELQDKSNFNISNINRIVRLFAHPFRWSKGFGGSRMAGGNQAELDTGPDKMPNVDNLEAEINQLSPVGDVPGAVQHSQNLRQMIFDVTRNTDITSMKDKVGALTNFGLKILFFDALNKLETKRELYGWGIREINRRLLLFSNMEPAECELVWEDPLPQDEQALYTNTQAALSMGLISKETAAAQLGFDYEAEKEKMAEEAQEVADIGTQALVNFERFGFSGARGGETIGNRQPLQVGNRANTRR